MLQKMKKKLQTAITLRKLGDIKVCFIGDDA